MKKKFGQMLCMALAVMMVFTIFAAFPASAADTEYWQAVALKKDTPVQMFNGVNVTAAEDFSLKGAKANIDGHEFTDAIAGSGNGKVDQDPTTGALTVSGCVLKIETQRSGHLDFGVKLDNSRKIRAANAKNVSEFILQEDNDSGQNKTQFFGFDIAAGETYYFWGTNTKPYIYGAAFTEIKSVSANTGETVTIKAQPNSNALLGNVSIDDDSIAIEQNQGMTESKFTMPDKNVKVCVDFVSSAVMQEVQKIPFDEIKGDNVSEDKIFDNLKLFDSWTTSIGYADVKWTSSDESVISISGEVNAKAEETKVTLTAVLTFQDYPNITLTRPYELTVPADNDDVGAVNDAKEALTLGDTSSVKNNLELPTKGRRNTSITWTSSEPDIVAADGTVTPEIGVDHTVTLTATISRGAVSDTKTFEIFVPGTYPISFDRAAVSNAEGDVVITPADGDYLSHIVYTESISNITGKETIVATVYDGGAVTAEKTFNIKEYCEKPECENGSQTIIYIEKDALPVKADSKIELKAYDDIDQKTTELSKEPYVYSSGIASNPTVYVAGDSTACTYLATGDKNRFPQTGWAAVLGDYFTGAKVDDKALSGRSSLSFTDENNYKTIKNSIKPGDYFIVQFGHNDSKSNDDDNPHRFTDPAGDRFTEGSFKKNLVDNYINVALDKGAFPILTTSIRRRGTNNSNLLTYVNATRELGKELGLPVMDLYAKTNEYVERVGAEKAKDIYNYVKPHDSRFMDVPGKEFAKSQYYETGASDDTHINYFGAQLISQWFCDELTRLGHPLTTKRNEHTTAEADVPPYAEATGAAAAADAEITAAAEGDPHSVIYDYDDTLGTVEILVGGEPLPSEPTASEEPKPTPGEPTASEEPKPTPGEPTASEEPKPSPGDTPASEEPLPSDSPQPNSYEITAAAFTDGGVKVDYTAGDGDAIIVIATYENDAITAVTIDEADKSGSQTLEYTRPASGETKVFIWNSRDNISPLCAPCAVE